MAVASKQRGRSNWFENPILTRELRTRMRGARAFWVLFAYLGILSIILFVTYLQWWNNNANAGPTMGAFRVGREFYFSLFIVKALLVAAITPALTAGGVSIEKEQRTFDLLTISLLPRSSVVIGKLLSALAFVALLLTSSLPLVSLGFLLGGVSPEEVTVSYALLLLAAFVYGSIGIAASSVSKNTTSATVLTYGVIIVLFCLTLPLSMYGLAGMSSASGGVLSTGGLKAINPVGAVIAGTMKETYFTHVVPAWGTALVVNGIFGVICVLVAIHRFDWPRSDRSGLLRVLIAAYTGLIAFALYGLFLPGATPIYSISDINTAVMLTIFGLSVLIPIFATADELPKGNLYSAMLDPRRLFKGEAPSGVLYLLLTTLLCFAIFRWGLTQGNATPAILAKANGVPLVKLSTFIKDLDRIGPFLIATTWLTSAFGIFLTAVLRNRSGAMAAVAGAVAFFYVVPFAYFGVRSSNAASKPVLLDQIAAFTPLLIPQIILNEGKGMVAPSGQVDFTPKEITMFGKMSLATSAPLFYTLGGCVFFIAADVIHRRRGKKTTVVPTAEP